MSVIFWTDYFVLKYEVPCNDNRMFINELHDSGTNFWWKRWRAIKKLNFHPNIKPSENTRQLQIIATDSVMGGKEDGYLLNIRRYRNQVEKRSFRA